MQRIIIAFDVDGTLRCNCTDTCRDPNYRVVALFKAFQYTKNVELYVWSGGGADYAYEFAQLFGLDVKRSRCLSKVGTNIRPDIAFDDQHEFMLADKNIIVREK